MNFGVSACRDLQLLVLAPAQRRDDERLAESRLRNCGTRPSAPVRRRGEHARSTLASRWVSAAPGLADGRGRRPCRASAVTTMTKSDCADAGNSRAIAAAARLDSAPGSSNPPDDNLSCTSRAVDGGERERDAPRAR